MSNSSDIASFCVLTIVFVSLMLVTAQPTAAQFIDLRLDVDSELTASTEQPLDFGTLTTNSGRRMIDLGSMNMGVFSITALENQLLLVTLNKPDVLQHDNPAIKDTIPLNLFARYGFSYENYQGSTSLPEETNYIKVETNPELGPWNTVYIFMYGSINIGNVPDGVYSNEVVLNVEYI